MPTQIHGLPAHVLLIHVVVVLVPVAALVLVAQAWSRPVRRWAGVGGPLLCLGALVMVPVTTNAGYWLRRHINPQLAASEAVRRHARLGAQLLPWVIAMFVLSVAVWWLGRQATRATRASGAAEPAALQPAAGTAGALVIVQVVIAVLGTVAAAGSVWKIYQIGDSGAKAVWTGSVVTK